MNDRVYSPTPAPGPKPACDVAGEPLRPRLDRALGRLQDRHGYEYASEAALTLAVTLARRLLATGDKAPAGPSLAAAEPYLRAAEEYLAQGRTRAARIGAERVLLGLLRADLPLQGLFPALNVNDPKGAARAALQLALDRGDDGAARAALESLERVAAAEPEAAPAEQAAAPASPAPSPPPSG